MIEVSDFFVLRSPLKPVSAINITEEKEDTMVLVSLSKPGYPEVKTLTDFNLVVSCIDDKKFFYS